MKSLPLRLSTAALSLTLNPMTSHGRVGTAISTGAPILVGISSGAMYRLLSGFFSAHTRYWVPLCSKVVASRAKELAGVKTCPATFQLPVMGSAEAFSST